MRLLARAGIRHEIDSSRLNCKETIANLVEDGKPMVSPSLTEWKPAELALQGRDTARFKLALPLRPARSPVLDLVEESSVSLGVRVPNAV